MAAFHRDAALPSVLIEMPGESEEAERDWEAALKDYLAANKITRTPGSGPLGPHRINLHRAAFSPAARVQFSREVRAVAAAALVCDRPATPAATSNDLSAPLLGQAPDTIPAHGFADRRGSRVEQRGGGPLVLLRAARAAGVHRKAWPAIHLMPFWAATYRRVSPPAGAPSGPRVWPTDRARDPGAVSFRRGLALSRRA